MKLVIKILGGIIGLIVLIGLGLYFFGTTDLRTRAARTNPNPEKARELLQDMAKAHQIHNWDSVSTYTVQFQENMYGVIGKSSNPFPEATSQFELSYIPNTYDGRLEFTDGPSKGMIWGLQSWQSYTVGEDDAPVFEEDANIIFWLPTYQYFIEFPRRIQNASVLACAGDSVINGIACHGVLASWNTLEPQRLTDQYLIWIDKASKRIVKLEYTVRDQLNFITGAASFNDYQDFEGILLPTKFPVESNLLGEGELLHEMEILGFQRNVLTQDFLRPDPALISMEQKK